MNDLLARTRPSQTRLSEEWAPDPSLIDQFADGLPRRWPRRRLLLSGVAIAGLAVGGSVASQIGGPVQSASAAPLRLAAAGAAQQVALRWRDGQFLHVLRVVDQTGPLPPEEDGHLVWDSWFAPDGWQWCRRQMGDGSVWAAVFRPGTQWMNPSYAAGLPTDPAQLDTFLRARVQGASGPDEAVFNAVTNMLMQEAAPPAVRAAALEVLARNPHVHATPAHDPAGRSALAVSFTQRPGAVTVEPGGNTLYLGATTGDLLGYAYRSPNPHGMIEHREAVTLREVVDRIPSSVIASVGQARVERDLRRMDR